MEVEANISENNSENKIPNKEAIDIISSSITPNVTFEAMKPQLEDVDFVIAELRKQEIYITNLEMA